MRQMEMARPLRRGSGVALRGCGYCRVVRNDLPPEGIETERKEEKQFRYLTHGKVRGLHAALSLNGGGPLMVPG